MPLGSVDPIKCFTNCLQSSDFVPIKMGCSAGQEDQFPLLS